MAHFTLAARPEFQRFAYTVDLDGVVFGITHIWSEREQRWYMDLRDNDGSDLRMGLAMPANWPILRLMKQATRPGGEIVIVAIGDEPTDPTRDELGAEKPIVYIDAESLAAVEAAL